MSRLPRHVLLLALAAGSLAGCFLELDCYEDRTLMFRIVEPPAMDLEMLVRACEADATRCKPLCERVVYHLGSFPPEVTACKVTHDAAGHDLEITYEAFQSGGSCGHQLAAP